MSNRKYTDSGCEHKIRLIDIAPYVKETKNITTKNVIRILKVLPKVIYEFLLKRKEVTFSGFMKFGFRVAKDRMITSSITHEQYHMPQHLRFKAYFYPEFKNYINDQ